LVQNTARQNLNDIFGPHSAKCVNSFLRCILLL